MNVVDSLVVTLGLNTTGFTQGMTQVQVDLQRTTTFAQASAKQIEDSGRRASEFFRRLRNEALALAAVLIGFHGIRDFTKDIVQGDAATGRLAAALKMSTTVLTAWQQAVERSGGSIEGVNTTFRELTQDVENFKLTGTTSMMTFLQRLGITNMKELEDLPSFLIKISEQFQKMDPREATVIGAGLHLDQGMVNFLRLGPAEVRRVLEAQRQLGVTTDADVRSAIALKNAFADLEQIAMSFGRTLLTELSPDIQSVLRGMVEWVRDGDWLKQNIVATVREFRDWLHDFDWKGLRDGAAGLWAEIDKVVQSIGGWKTVGEIVLAGWAVSKLGAIAAGIGGIVAVLANPVVLAALAAWTAYYIATERFRTPQTPEEYDTAMRRLSFDSPLWAGVPEETKKKYFPAGRPPSLWEQYAPSSLGGGRASDARKAALRDTLAADPLLGISKEAASGMVANLDAESGLQGINELNPKQGRGGFGWAQWTGSRRIDFEKWVATHPGMDPASDEANYGFLVHELTTNPAYAGTLAALRANRITATQAAHVFFQGYESGGDPGLEGSRAGHTGPAEHILALPSTGPTPASAGPPVASTPPALRFSVPLDPALLPKAGPSPSIGQTSYNNDNSRSSEMHIGQIAISTAATDADGIARGIGPALRRYSYVSAANTGLA